MPVKDGIIYSTVENGVKIGIGWHEVAALLGCGPDEGQCCSSPNINKWSKYKPIRVDKPGDINDTDRANANQGFDLANTDFRINGIDELKAKYVSNVEFSWPYLPIRPWTDWSRITDFDGYNQNALPPLSLANTEIIWDTSQTTLQELSVTSFFRLKSGYFGPPVNMQLCLDEFEFGQSVGTGFSNLYLALVVFTAPNVSGNNANAVAISEYPLKGGSATPPIIYPGRWANFATLLNGLAEGESLRCMAVMTPQPSNPTGTEGRNGSISYPCYRYPQGDILTITKISTPPWLWTARNLIKVFYYDSNGNSTYEDGYKYINQLSVSSSNFQQIARHSGYRHSLLMVATIRNERSVTQTLKAGGCQLIFCKTGTNGAVINGDLSYSIGTYRYPAFYCSALVQNPNIDSGIYNIGSLRSEITVAPNASVTIGFVVDMNWDKFNELFPYVSSQPTNTPTNCPVLLRLGDCKPYIGTKVSETQYTYDESLASNGQNGGYQYYWRISQ